MKDPERLLSSRHASAHERALLEAGSGEEPPADGAARLALALGIPPLATSAAPPTAAEAAAGKVASAGTIALGKWVGLVTGAAVIAGSSYFAYGGTTAPREGERAAEHETAREQQTVRSADDRDQLAPTVPAVEAAGSASIAEEITRLERVRNALKSRDGVSARRELSAYDRAFSRGALREEADFLHIETQVTLGEKERARWAGEGFLRAHPSSVHGARVRTLLESLDGG